VAAGGPSGLCAVVPVRGGLLPLGGEETVAEAGGVAVLAGDGTAAAAAGLPRDTDVRGWEAGPYAPATWAATLAPVLADVGVIVLPASPDGRDLAPRLAAELGRPLHAGATLVRADRVELARADGRLLVEVAVGAPVVATLLPGVRGVEPAATGPVVRQLDPPPVRQPDPQVVEVLPPDPATMDLAEARRIVAGGAGLGGPEAFALLERVATALGASMAGTRLVADLGWVGHERYIGTTGVAVDPDLYVAFGISGAVQHVTGLGTPEHVVSVNTDGSAPMMAMADLALVADAPAVLAALVRRLGLDA
jgi:electron transfer flavoprotein alpha subunit